MGISGLPTAHTNCAANRCIPLPCERLAGTMKTVFVNGTFDILHVGHIALLDYAKSLGDQLVVGIDSDDRVRLLKGSNRPINSQLERGTILSALKSVDEVFVFDTDDELRSLIQACDIMVKGSDYRDTGTDYGDDGEECGDINCEANR